MFPGSNRYRILPLHSQIPREEQRRVFEPVPDNITKVWDAAGHKYFRRCFLLISEIQTRTRTSINVSSSIINLMAVVAPSQEKTKRLSHVLVVFSFLPHVGHEEPSLFVPSATNLLNKLCPSLTPTFIQICVAWITFYSFQSHVVLKESAELQLRLNINYHVVESAGDSVDQHRRDEHHHQRRRLRHRLLQVSVSEQRDGLKVSLLHLRVKYSTVAALHLSDSITV